jgi:Flp pilus assembly protein CpaB
LDDGPVTPTAAQLAVAEEGRSRTFEARLPARLRLDMRTAVDGSGPASPFDGGSSMASMREASVMTGERTVRGAPPPTQPTPAPADSGRVHIAWTRWHI